MAGMDIDSIVTRARGAIVAAAGMAGVASVGGFLRYAAERFATRQTLRVAASLSYTSLLALVPLAAIGVAFMSAFPVFDDARSDLAVLIFDNIAPHAGQQVQDYLDRFVGNTGRLTTVGVIGLAVTALLLLSTIENAFNVIWGVTEKRALLTRLFAYWATVTVGPLALGTGISISSWLFAIDASDLGLGGVREILLGMAPLLLAALGFTVLYVALPARTVRWRHAFGGAVVAALLFEALKFGFGAYVDAAGSYASVYGPLAALPLFLMWMYLAWAVILLGAVVAAAWPEWQALRRERAAPATPVRQVMRALLVLQQLRDAGAAAAPVDDEALLEATGGNNLALGAVLSGLRDAGLVARTETGTLVLARDLDGVTLHHVRDALGLGLGDLAAGDVGEPAWQAEFERIVAALNETGQRVLDVPVKDLFDEAFDGGTPLVVAGGRSAGE